MGCCQLLGKSWRYISNLIFFSSQMDNITFRPFARLLFMIVSAHWSSLLLLFLRRWPIVTSPQLLASQIPPKLLRYNCWKPYAFRLEFFFILIHTFLFPDFHSSCLCDDSILLQHDSAHLRNHFPYYHRDNGPIHVPLSYLGSTGSYSAHETLSKCANKTTRLEIEEIAHIVKSDYCIVLESWQIENNQ